MSVDLFVVSGQSNEVSNLEGGYEQLRKMTEKSLRNGDSLIILCDYSFDRAGLDNNANGITWMNELSQSFATEKESSQLTIFGHTDAHLQNNSIGELFTMYGGAKKILPKRDSPEKKFNELESESVLNRITYLLKMDDGSVFELLSDDLVRQLVPGTDAQSRLIRHNLRDILGYIDITGAVSKEVISKLKTLLSILKEFSGRLDFEDGHSLMNVLQNSRFSKLLYFRFNTPENIDVEKRLSQELASFLFNLMSVFESNLIDLLKGDYVKNGYLRMDAYYIVPFLLIINA